MRKTKKIFACKVGYKLAQILTWLFFLWGMILVMHVDKIALDMCMLH